MCINSHAIKAFLNGFAMEMVGSTGHHALGNPSQSIPLGAMTPQWPFVQGSMSRMRAMRHDATPRGAHIESVESTERGGHSGISTVLCYDIADKP